MTPRKHSVVIACLLALTLQACDANITRRATITLRPGETYDGVHGLCKWSWYLDEPKPIWGEPNKPCASPFGEGQPVEIPSRTDDGAFILEGSPEGASPDKPYNGYVVVSIPLN